MAEMTDKPKGKVCRVKNQSTVDNAYGIRLKKYPCFFIVACPCDSKYVSLICAKPNDALPTHCPDCDNELEESTNLEDFQ